jgi:hypothetical protein
LLTSRTPPWSGKHLSTLVIFGVGFLIGIRASNRTYHVVLAIAWLLTCLFWGVAGFREPIVAP